MKSCPQCGRSYPDTESFCDVDGTALGQSGSSARPRGTEAMTSGVTCPACGGSAEPGDEGCRFCGASLPASGVSKAATGSPVSTSARLGTGQSFDDEPSEAAVGRSTGRRMLAGIGYTLAA